MRPAPPPVTLRQLQYVVAVADLRSFRRAAEVCGVSQPSLSAQLAQAERALGIQLFERGHKRVMVTPAGASVVEQARRVLLQADELVEMATRAGDPLSGTLRLGIIPTVGPYLLPVMAPNLRDEFPRINQIWVEDRTATLMESLADGRLDGAVVALEAELGSVDQVILGFDPFVVAVPLDHPMAQRKRPVRMSELEGERVLLLEDGHCFRNQALEVCASAGVDELGFRATSLPTLTQMVAIGAGITLLPTMSVALENRHGGLAIRRLAGKPAGRTIALVWRRGSALKATLEPVAQVMQRSYRTLERR